MSAPYLSHTIVQLFPVPYRTKNCVGLVAEFATNDPEGLIARFHQLLEKYTLSKKTGMAAYTGFAPSEKLLAYGRKVKRGEVDAHLVDSIQDPGLRIVMNGRGIVGAVAAIPFFTRYEEALELCSGKN
jgi:tRNA(Ile2) C34 agmatinyltransferase TiaS